MFRKPLFWIALLAASLGSVFFSAKYFSRAFPIVTLDLRMDRGAALAKAAELAARFHLPPAGYRQVASFSGDQEVQNFVELEGGGTQAFRNMMAEGLYHPYKWAVRHFKPGETHETRLLFTPRGEPYGFSVKLPEKEPGAALSVESARQIAEQSATRDWQVDLSRYRLVEKAQEVRPSGRVDHTFVYERPDVRIGEGRYRLRLEIGGDALTELSYFVKVPEAFSRRYEEMRSANNVISVSGVIALVVMYFLGCCGVGLFFLLRRRWILWRQPLLWGCFIAVLQLLAGLNQWPLIWMDYDTAISAQGFVLKQVLSLLLGFLLNTALFTISFMAAESLSRRAFPDHAQMWRLWSAEVAGSRAILGRTAAGYALVTIFFAYEVLLYFVTTRTLGWWTPSDILVQPDILATYLPWLSPIAISAQAGFWEESFFRAVPLACAALLGTRFGRRNWWIAGAMILQALIFGSGHAGYANQPSYARLVELIIPSFMFGGLYLCFGLLPGIVLHYTFDVVWFALPLFVSSAPGIWWNRILVIILVFVPLWVVVGGRLRARKWTELPPGVLNRAWQPPESAPPAAPEEKQAVGAINVLVLRLLPVAGILGLVFWVFMTNFKSDAPPLTISRSTATAMARQALKERKVDLPPPWIALASVETQPNEQDRFVWETAGREIYRSLMNEYLTPPHWRVRFVRFEGNVEETAEEYQAAISDAKGVYRVRHILPEARAGASISEEEARSLARATLKTDFSLDPAELKEVSAVPSKLKARTDWVFTFSDPKPPSLPQGEKRLGVQIAGDQVTDAYRFVHVPEDWQRQQRDKETIPNIVRVASNTVVALIVVAGLSFAIWSWSRKRFIVGTFIVFSVVLLTLNLVGLLNSLPELSSQFSTAQPYKVQMFLLLGLAIVAFLVLAVGIGLVAGLLHAWCKESRKIAGVSGWVAGVSLGVLSAGVAALGSALRPQLAPMWGDFSPLGSYAPFLALALSPLASYLSQSVIGLLIFASVSRLTREWSARRALLGILLFVSGFVLAGTRGPETVSSWLVAGSVTGILILLLYLLVIRYSLPVVLLAVGVFSLLATIKQRVMAPSMSIFPGTVIGIILLVAGACVLYRRLSAAANHPCPEDSGQEQAAV